jgi:NitT/TauT family transport system substrate-binding protein
MLRGPIISMAIAVSILFAGLAEAETLTKVRVAEVVRAHLFDPMYVAIEKGFVRDEGIDAEVITVTNVSGVGALIVGGQADIALSGTQIPIYLYGGESLDKPIIFSALAGTDGLYLVSRRKIDDFDWSMLNGQKILGYQPGSAPASSLAFLMRQHGVDPETMKAVINNIGPAARDGAWISGLGDFGLFIEPSTTKLVTAGQAYVVASMGKELGRADYSLFFANRSWIGKHPETAQKWTNAIARAMAWMKTASSPEIAAAVSSFFPGLSLEDNIAVIDRFRATGAPIWSETTEVDRAGLAKFQEVMVAGGTLPPDKIVAYDTIVTNQFSKTAQQRLTSR